MKVSDMNATLHTGVEKRVRKARVDPAAALAGKRTRESVCENHALASDPVAGGGVMVNTLSNPLPAPGQPQSVATPREIVEAHPFFRGLPREQLNEVVRGAHEVVFESGEYLFHEGEPANRFFLVTEGRVALEAHEAAKGTVPVQEVGEGEVVGWSWLFPPFAWHLRARATAPTTALALDGAHLLVTAERCPEFGYELMKRVSAVVIQRLQATRRKLIEMTRDAR
jgi:hypothetical protein